MRQKSGLDQQRESDSNIQSSVGAGQLVFLEDNVGVIITGQEGEENEHRENCSVCMYGKYSEDRRIKRVLRYSATSRS